MNNSHNNFINRELSWLDFNFRVLEEAQDTTNPLLERFNFLAITASNLDEFFMVRVAGLKDQLAVGYNKKDDSGLTPEKLLQRISKQTHKMLKKQYSCLKRSLLLELMKSNIRLLKYKILSVQQKKYLANTFAESLYPILTPMAVDKSRPFPLLTNNALHLAVRLKNNDEDLYAVVQVPSLLSRFIWLPSANGQQDFIMLEDVLIVHLNKLFVGYNIKSVTPFRLTRNADLDIDEVEAEDLLRAIEKSLEKRKFGAPIRLELEAGCDPKIEAFLIEMLNIAYNDIYHINGPLDLTAWQSFRMESYSPDEWKYELQHSQPAADFFNTEDMFETIKQRDCLVHHPYESFQCVIDFINQAAHDPNVLAIKQTLYRVSGNSPIILALIEAAKNGKQVTVLVELKARFDERNNIAWARALDNAGCHVVYGLAGLKVHAKCTLVVRKEDDGIRRYVHLSTGNYNDSTAKLYTDIGYFTCKETYSSDIASLFNLITGYSIAPNWRKLIIAPYNLREEFIEMIKKEIYYHQQGRQAKIIAKMNSLVDPEIIEWLYEAAKSGVEIDLIVRGICCLKTGLPFLENRIRVLSIVDKYLEHSRIYYFTNGGNKKIYLSSADMMPRNLDRRIEAMIPIEDPILMRRLISILETNLNDTVKARVMQSDDSYKKIDRRGKPFFQAQSEFYADAVKNINEITSAEQFKPVDMKIV